MSHTSEGERGVPAVSVVVPVHNEADNIPVLVDEIAAALAGREPFEVIFVNDGSSDGTGEVLKGLMATRPWLRQIKHKQSAGQSAAIRTGMRVEGVWAAPEERKPEDRAALGGSFTYFRPTGEPDVPRTEFEEHVL